MRKAQLASVASLIGLALISSGCTQFRAHQGYIGDATLMSSVQPGVDNKTSVQTSLGRPTFTGQFGNSDWYYFSRNTKQLAFSQPKATEQNVLHIQFDKAGNVSSVTNTGVEKIANLSPNGDKTPTLGRHTSFFQEIFGNIGTVGAPGAGGGGSQN